MAKFKFRLQTFLNLKEQFEKNAKNELGIAIKKLEEEKAKLAAIEKEIESSLNKFRDACQGNIVPEKIKELKRYLEYLDKKQQEQILNVKREQQNVDKIREKLVEIMKERKVLENLKDKDFQEFVKEEEKVERQLVDELVSYKEAAKR